MLGFTGVKQPVERPGPLLLAIREWQRQLVEMAEAAKRQVTPAPAAHDYSWPEADLFDDA
jgi:hypothetical protein